MINKVSQSQRTNTVWFHSYGVLRKVKFIETENRMVVARGWGGEVWSYYLMGTEFQFYKMKRVLEMAGGDGCTTM